MEAPSQHRMFQRSRVAEMALVGAGVVSGLALTAAVWLIVYPRLPEPTGSWPPSERLLLVARLLVWPAAWMFALVIAVANSRTLLDALNPLRRRETRFIDTTIRVLKNTTEQTVIFALALLAFSVVGELEAVKVAPLLTGLFVLGRVLFWVGYLIDPMYRGTGLWVTWAVNGGMIVYVLHAQMS